MYKKPSITNSTARASSLFKKAAAIDKGSLPPVQPILQRLQRGTLHVKGHKPEPQILAPRPAADSASGYGRKDEPK
jgi:hypothetical protein